MWKQSQHSKWDPSILVMHKGEELMFWRVLELLELWALRRRATLTLTADNVGAQSGAVAPVVQYLLHVHETFGSISRGKKNLRNPDLPLLCFMSRSVCWHVYLCTACVPGTHGGRKRVSHLLELELWVVVVNHDMLLTTESSL